MSADCHTQDWTRQLGADARAQIDARAPKHEWQPNTGTAYPSEVRGMPNDVYHAQSAVSSSGLADIRRSIAHYHAPTPFKQAFFDGNAIHCAVLEQGRFSAQYATKMSKREKPTALNLSTKEGKAWKESAAGVAWYAECADVDAHNEELAKGWKIGISETLMRNCNAIADAAHAHTRLGNLLKSGEAEVSFFAQDPQYNIPLRCRFDWLTPRGLGIDLKTTNNASPDAFMRSVVSYDYHVRSLFYERVYELVTGEELRGFIFAAVEKEPPYGVALYTLDDAWREDAEAKMHESLRIYAEWFHSQDYEDGHTPCYPEPITTLAPPSWMTR